MANLDTLDVNSLLANLFRVGPTEQERQAAASHAFAKMGLGILAANQPSPVPRSSLGVLAQGGLSGMDAYGGELSRLMAERRAGGQTALAAMQIKKALDQQEALKNFNNNPGAAAPTGSTPAGMSPSTSSAAFGTPDFASAPPPQPSPQVPNYESLIQGGVPAPQVNALMEAFKLRYPEVKFDTSGLARHGRTGMPVEGVPSAAHINPQGFGTTPRFDPQTRQVVIGPTPGSEATYALQQNIGERAKAMYDPFMGQVDPMGRPIPQTRLQFANRISRETAPAGQPMPPVGMGPTPAERAAAEHLGTGVGTQAAKVMTDAASSALQLREIDQISALTQGLNTGKLEPFKIGIGQWIIGSGLESPEWVKKNITDVPRAEAIIGAVNKMVAVAVRQTDAQPAVRQIDMLRKSYPGVMQTQEGLTLLTGILRDAHVYNIEKLREQQKFVASGGKLSDFESHWTEVAKQMPLFKNFPQAAPIPKEPGQPPPVMTDKPPAAQHKGRVIEDESGKRFRSDGMSWKPL